MPRPGTGFRARVEVLTKSESARRNWNSCKEGEDFRFSTDALRYYSLSTWEPVIFDAMLLTAVAEYADAVVPRPPHQWKRHLYVSVPVHEPERWNARGVLDSLRLALGLLTGDAWEFQFRPRQEEQVELQRSYLSLSSSTAACMPYSAGLDSLAVAGIERCGLDEQEQLVLVRVQKGGRFGFSGKVPFVKVPYSISYRKRRRRESSGRSRGFKFFLISGLAAYLTNAPRVVCPESGQGILGPALLSVGQPYPDYRNHPLFARRMEIFLKALLGLEVQYSFPRLWFTKGETISQFVDLTGGDGLEDTKSCWRDSRSSSLDGSWRHCGLCAACMLRRLSLHAADRNEPTGTYRYPVDRELSLEPVNGRVFAQLTSAFRADAVAGTLHMRYMTELAGDMERIRGHAAVLSPVLGLETDDVERRIRRLFEQHREEWAAYLQSVERNSLVWELGSLN